MSLFACSSCNSIENTALSNYLARRIQRAPVLCSACDLNIGEWHGQFDRLTLEEANYQLCPDYNDDNGCRIVCPKPDGWHYCKHRQFNR